MTSYHLAQFNSAQMRFPLNDPKMIGFTSQLESINALAEKADGFIWRLQDDEGNATSLRVFDNDMILVNMSVWQSVEALYQYSYYSDHAKVFKQRKDWFDKIDKHDMALWWIPQGHTPSLEEAKEKLELIRLKGPSAEAFTFKERFTAPHV